ncbi:MAG TPA: G/U mismatch-specific DNA glycosylase [Actinomycetota bacterium]|nr:G/U mismatch-specific DNA glycosylase [Actinomycetota bacterium]
MSTVSGGKVDAAWRPSKDEIASARGGTIPDIISPGLNVVFCGINPSLYSAAVGHHFARPGNRFWKALYQSGFTDRLLSPFEDGILPSFGLGLTNLVSRATSGAEELTVEELVAGASNLSRKVRSWEPKILAVLGVGAYRTAFGEPGAGVGVQDKKLGNTRLWVLPNPSGLNAHYQLADIAACLTELREAIP